MQSGFMGCYDNFLFNFLGAVFGYVVDFFYELFKNYGLAIVFFTIFTRILLFPLSIKQQKQMIAQQRIQPKLAELREKYANNQQLLNTEMQKLYEKEGVKMSMGCGSMLIQMPLFIGMYMAVRKPLTHVLRLGKETINSLYTIFGINPEQDYYSEVNLLSRIRDMANGELDGIIASASDVVSGTNALASASDAVASASDIISSTDAAMVVNQVSELLGSNMDAVERMSQSFNFLGFDLLQIASFKPLNSALILAVLVFVFQAGSMYISNLINKVSASSSPQGCSPNAMAIGMGAFSFWISLSIPAAFPLYWATSSLLAPIQTWVTKKYFGALPMNAKAEAQRNAMLKQDEAEIIQSINSRKGEKKFKPSDPNAERIAGGIQGGSASNRKGGNKKGKKK